MYKDKHNRRSFPVDDGVSWTLNSTDTAAEKRRHVVDKIKVTSRAGQYAKFKYNVLAMQMCFCMKLQDTAASTKYKVFTEVGFSVRCTSTCTSQ